MRNHQKSYYIFRGGGGGGLYKKAPLYCPICLSHPKEIITVEEDNVAVAVGGEGRTPKEKPIFVINFLLL